MEADVEFRFLISCQLQTNGVLCTFNEAIQQLIFFENKQRRRVPWNCDLEIGTKLRFPIAAYIMVRAIILALT